MTRRAGFVDVFYYFLVKGANRLREIDFQIPLGTFIIVYTYSVSHRLQ